MTIALDAGLVERDLPLSPAQERLWFIDRLRPGDTAYNIYPPAFRMRGTLDVDVLRRALAEVARRHEPLRTRFPDRRGEPVQQVLAPGPVPIQHVDLSGLPAGERERRLPELVRTFNTAAFDLARGPLLRVGLARLGPADHLLQLAMHHIVGDGSSTTVLIRELADLYAAYLAGEPSPLPDLPLGWGDHVLAERERLAGPAAAEALEFWSERLADPPVLELPTDRPRPPVLSSASDVLARWWPAELTVEVEALARRQRSTLFMTLLAAYQLLLARHSGQRDICVGVPLAGRDRVELEPMIGYLATTVALRADLSDDPTFSQLLRRTRTAVLCAFAHQDVPIERLIGELGVERDLSRPAFMQTTFALQNQHTAPLDLPGLAVEPYFPEFQHVKFELQVDAYRGREALLVQFGYNVDLYDRATIERMSDRYERLLAAIVADPDRPVSELPLLGTGELKQLLEWSTNPATPRSPRQDEQEAAPGPAPGRHGTVLDAVEERARRTPAATAVRAGDIAVSYGELLDRAGRLAGALAGAGIGRESIVGVCLPRTPDLLVALLAVWRAGAAYLPIDPALPAERVDFLLSDSGAAALITDSPGRRTIPVLPATAAGPPARSRPAPGDAAYVIYTSGSTGQPKGVLVEHGSLAARVSWMTPNYGITETDSVLQFASIGFDTSAEEIWPTLAAGATCVLMPGGAALLPDLLAGPAGAAITVLDLPTSYWHELVALGDRLRWPERLRLVIVGGSELYGGAVEAWRTRFGDRVRLVNTYGPTEATIIATAAEVGPGSGPGSGPGKPPIGRPIERAYVLDERLRLAPVGVPGELCVGGAGVARGYLGRPELTADRFVPDPYGPPGARLYRTGDRARWLADGQLEFLGRLDGQLKVRGYRVEPGEIEARLRGHPGVTAAAVIARDDRLVAYVVPADPDAPPGAAELRAALARTLPGYLVPAVYVPVERLPLTPNGKVNPRALPAPDLAAEPAATGAPPGTQAEELVAEVWAEVLGLQRVGADDDFFALGGHSLLATKVTARLRDAIDLEVPVRAVFENPSLAALAAAVEALLLADIEALDESEVDSQLNGLGFLP
jgi:amino acid adenylation domain-containing protein